MQSNSNFLIASAIFIVKENPTFRSDFTVEGGVNAYRTWQVITFPCLRVSGSIFRTFGLSFQSLKGSKALDFTCLLQLGEVLDRPDHLAGVAIFVVIPGNDLHLIGVVVDKPCSARLFGTFAERHFRI